MNTAPPDAPAFPSYGYCSRPPKWVRDLLVLMCGLLFIAGCAGALGYAAESVVEEVVKASSPTLFHADDAGFTALFPLRPLRNVQKVSEPGFEVDVTTYEATKNGVTYAVASMPIGGLELDLVEGAKEVVDEGTVESQISTMFRGFTAVETVFTDSDGVNRHMIVRASSRVLQVFVIGGTAQQYMEFRDSVELL